eukprot:TRINITY_DN4058_c1_g1_i3.p1 TRINITY_DN4058_c1_g1~~TRINITY_DN4058_c1_g1_i3.p1  ORF type:complete len:538 (+),score=103.80 TRINITY_DN4058_c1_g1_i3:81-1694(+)
MGPPPEWTPEVERSWDVIVAAALSAGLEAEAGPALSYLRQGGCLPNSSLPPPLPPAAAAVPASVARQDVYTLELNCDLFPPPTGSMRPTGRVERERRNRKPHALRAPEFAASAELVTASATLGHVVAVTMQGAITCGSDHPRPRLPWPAAAVNCFRINGYPGPADWCGWAEALRRGGGAVCRWALDHDPGSDGGAEVVEVRGLPFDDPVVTLESSSLLSLAITRSGQVYGWGFAVQDGSRDVLDEFDAVPIDWLTRIRPRRLCVAWHEIMVEAAGAGEPPTGPGAEQGELRLFPFPMDFRDPHGPRSRLVPPAASRQGSLRLLDMQWAAAVALPLRSITACDIGFALVDAVGKVWIYDESSPPRYCMYVLPLPDGQRAVQIAGGADWENSSCAIAVVALTEGDELWATDQHYGNKGYNRWRRISAALPGMPLGLLPYGGGGARRIIFLPNRSCGKARLRLFARTAVRLGLPSDPLRAVLLRYAVDSMYVFGPEHHPFCCTTAGPEHDPFCGRTRPATAANKQKKKRKVVSALAPAEC